MGVEVSLQCDMCPRSETVPFDKAADGIQQLVDQGWEVYNLFGTGDASYVYCPNCVKYHRLDQRMLSKCKPVSEVDEGYFAEDTGVLYRRWQHWNRDKQEWVVDWDPCKTYIDAGGYVRVSLKKEHKCVDMPVHRVVCAAWHGLPEGERCHVDHINRVRSDNRPENLRWVTHAENQGNKSGHSRPVVAFNEDGDVLHFSGISRIPYKMRGGIAVLDGMGYEEQGYIFVDEEEWETGIQIGVASEQMREARYGVEEGK